ncbi:plasmid recombination protein [Shewanella mangrovisoli]|uniref:plasmid recombination protein n=1 Tax=Shewanella mangrovisoli TaxID=2864211 RepID=UPI00370A8C4C
MKKHIQTVIRMEKIKTFSELKNKCLHNMRLINVPNSDNSNNIKVLFGTVNIINDVRKLLEEKRIDIGKVRKDAVIATEIVVSLSPSFFTENELDFNGKFNKKNVKDFVKIASQHVQTKFGDSVVAAYLHLDESTPHIHFFVVPIVSDSIEDCKYRLSCKDFFNKSALINLQADYCNEFNKLLGNEYVFEYKRNQKAKHSTLKDFYKNVNKTQEIIQERDLEIKRLNIKLVSNEYVYSSKIKALEKSNSKLEEDIKALNHILQGIKNTIIRFFSDKLSFFDLEALHFLKIKSVKDEKVEDRVDPTGNNCLEKELVRSESVVEESEISRKHIKLKPTT